MEVNYSCTLRQIWKSFQCCKNYLLYLHLRHAVSRDEIVVKVVADESVAPPGGHAPRPPFPLVEGGLRGPHRLEAAVLGAPITHHLLHKAEVNHCRE